MTLLFDATTRHKGYGLTDSIYLLPPVMTIDEAIDRMENIGAFAAENEARRSSDGVACFNDLYTVITKRVKDGISTGFFADGDFIERLDVAFANRYLYALRESAATSTDTPRSWAVLIEARGDDRIEPIQFAMAGVNAHINFDLAQALVQTCTELGRENLDQGTQHADYEKINQIFAEEMKGLREHFENRIERFLDRFASPILNVLGNWSVDKARDAAWDVGQHLWQLRRSSVDENQFVRHVDGLTALAGHFLLTPIG